MDLRLRTLRLLATDCCRSPAMARAQAILPRPGRARCQSVELALRSATYQQPAPVRCRSLALPLAGPSSLERAPGRFPSSETAETRRVVLALDRCHCPAAVRRGLALLPLASGSTSTPRRRPRSTLSTRSAGGCIRRFRCTAFRSRFPRLRHNSGSATIRFRSRWIPRPPLCADT